MNKGSIRYPGIKSIYAIPAKNFINQNQFNDSNKIDITLDTGILEISEKDSEKGNATEEYNISAKIAGISPDMIANFEIDKKYVLKVEFFYDHDVLIIGSRNFPAVITIESTTGQTGGNFIGREISFTCLFPTTRRKHVK